MKRGGICAWAVLMMFLPTGSAISQPASIGWPEAVARLAGERSKAETCVALLKRYGGQDQISRGQLTYVAAKADSDAAIAGLVVALSEGTTPESLPSLEARLTSGTSGLWGFCKTVNDLVPNAAGRPKNVLVDIAKATIEPVVKALIEGIATIYRDREKHIDLTRRTIQTQLEAAKWPNFGDVKAAE